MRLTAVNQIGHFLAGVPPLTVRYTAVTELLPAFSLRRDASSDHGHPDQGETG